MKKYQIIYADPPWKYGKWHSNLHRPSSKDKPLPYPSMTVEQICNLGVGSLANTDCELYLWTTQKYLPDAFKVIEAWGFTYKQTLVWCKKPRAGLGGAYTPSNEFLLLARKGRKPKAKRILTTWFLVKRPHNNHSKKPDFFRDMIESVTNKPRIELFARQKTEGWDVIGNDIDGKDIRETLENMVK